MSEGKQQTEIVHHRIHFQASAQMGIRGVALTLLCYRKATQETFQIREKIFKNRSKIHYL